MNKPSVLQVGELPDWDQVPLDENYDIQKYFQATDKAEFLRSVGPSIRGIATRGDLGANRMMIEACPNLEIIVVYGVGYDGVDVALCKERGIRVTNTPDVLTGDVADLSVAMMLGLSRGMIGAENWVRSGDWAAKGMYRLTQRVHKARAGVLGLGRIGTEVARRLEGFQMQIGYSSTTPKDHAGNWTFYDNAVDLARNSDFLFVTLAATAATRHIVNREVMEALGPTGVVINVSRAANVDETALLDALESGALGGAAIDVFEGEPNVNPRFLQLDNVLLQPHAGSGTFQTRKEMGQMLRDNLAAHFAGRELISRVI